MLVSVCTGSKIYVMTERDNLDLPPYDVTLLEAQRQARAKEFAKAVKSLTRFDMAGREDESDTWVMRGATYELPDDHQVDVMRQGYFTKPEHSTSAARILTPWVEHNGADGQRRRARIARYLALRITPDLNYYDDGSEDEPIESDFMLMRAIESLQKWREKEVFEKSMNPDYRPPELIDATTTTIVEVKLQRGPNWRTEYAATLNDPITKLSNLEARQQAGEATEYAEYSIQEHEGVMHLFKAIKSSKIKPVDLSQNII